MKDLTSWNGCLGIPQTISCLLIIFFFKLMVFL